MQEKKAQVGYLSTNKNEAGKDSNERPSDNLRHLKLSGVNIRSLFASKNSYCFYKTLMQQQPDIFFIVETWHQKNDSEALLDRNYKALFS